MRDCLRCRVTGRVQGVWFRASTQRQAQRLGLSGSVRNLPDGSVEVVACGEVGAVAVLHEWLWQGPEHARVADVQCESITLPSSTGFVIG